MTTLLRLNDVMKRVPLKRTAIYAAIKAGTFPAPVKLGGPNSASAWRVDELDAWLERISAERQHSVLQTALCAGSNQQVRAG